MSSDSRRHIPRARYRVRNRPAYEAGLKRRGDVTLRLDEAAVAEGQAPPRTTPGGRAWYSDAAIELVLMLRLVFRLALRRAEGFATSVLRLLGRDLRVPDHTTLSRRSRSFARRQPKVIPHGPMHPVIDSTGLKLFGRGGWDEEKHRRGRRSWRKLHLAVDAGTGEIGACVPTDDVAGDAGQVPVLLDAIEGEIAVGRYKAIIGPKLRARGLPAQQGEAAVAAEVLNRSIRVAKPVSIRVA